MNLLNGILIKKNVKVKKNGKDVEIINDSDQMGTVIVSKVFCNKSRKSIFISSKITGDTEALYIKIIGRTKHVLHTVEPNTEFYLNESPRIFFVGLRLEANSKVVIKDFNVEFDKSHQDAIDKHFVNDMLLVCPGYPSDSNKYSCAFIHSRVLAYKQAGYNVDVVVCNEKYINKTEKYKFEGINVICIGYNELRVLLQNKIYDTILIHFFDERYAQILDASNITNTKLFLYSHGTDTLYRAYDRICAHYFELKQPIPEYISASFPIKDEILKRYGNMPNVKFIFVSKWAKQLCEELNGIKLKNADVIPCNIDMELFKYKKKDPELRKKVFILRRYDNLSSYAIDINVRVILELSKRKCFKDMEFSIYGDGDFHTELMSPLRKFENVHIYKRFLSHEEIKKVHDENGIALFASRFDTQGVSAIEAAMSGNVVITSKGIGTEEYIDPSIGTYCETENYVEYADLIEELYNDEKKFLEMSEKCSKSVQESCSNEKTIEKDINMIKNDSSVKLEKYSYKKQDEKPLLSIVVPSYNCGKYLVNSIHSLIDQPLHNKIEVLIVNDGSKDDTAKVGKELENITKNGNSTIVKLIDKPNGGHGSTINKGIELATGKYFKLMDGDDYFITSELVKLLEILEKEDSDIILTNYIEDFAIDCFKHPVHNYDFLIPGFQYSLEDMTCDKYGFEKWGPLLSTTTIKTSILKNANFVIDEHCFYVDMEYNFIGYTYAKTLTYYNLDLYNYYLGRAGQSISAESFKRNYKHHETVILRLIKEYYSRCSDISDNKKEYLKNRIIIPMLTTQYDICLSYLDNRNGFIEFDNALKEYDEFYNCKEINNRVKKHRKTKGLLIIPGRKTIGIRNLFKRIAKFILRRR